MTIDPKQKALLHRLARATYVQERGGYYCPGKSKIQRKTIAPLMARGFVRLDHNRRGRPSIEVTAAGFQEIGLG